MLDIYLGTLFYLIGEFVIFLALVVLILSVIAALMILYSFKTGHFFAARLMLIGISTLENAIKSLFWIARADDAIVDDVGIRLGNYINKKKFARISRGERFIFMPQCVRSPECPAKLTPEGIRCIGCGRCRVGEAKKTAEDLGYKFFIVPGSSFIKRILKKYKPKAIIGVGCPMEIKQGLAMCHSYDIPAMGVPLSQAGCVATTLDWDALYDTLSDKP
jgi:hypothetical protein